MNSSNLSCQKQIRLSLLYLSWGFGTFEKNLFRSFCLNFNCALMAHHKILIEPRTFNGELNLFRSFCLNFNFVLMAYHKILIEPRTFNGELFVILVLFNFSGKTTLLDFLFFVLGRNCILSSNFNSSTIRCKLLCIRFLLYHFLLVHHSHHFVWLPWLLTFLVS